MFRNNYFAALLFAVVFGFGGIVSFAQDATTNTDKVATTITGKVVLKKGSVNAPVVGATVDCYNLTDFTQMTKTNCASTKTDEAGVFLITGLSPEGKYIITVSAEGAVSGITPPIAPGPKQDVITLKAGEKVPFTKLEVWQAFSYSKNASGGFSEDQKSSQAQYEKWISEAEDRNKKAAENNKRVIALLKEGSDAYEAKNYDLAIAKFEEGYNLSPEYIGSAPAFLNAKALALTRRGVDGYNIAIKTKDPATIKGAKATTKKDMLDAIEAAGKSYDVLAKAKSGSVSENANHKKNMYNAVDYARDAARLMVLIDLAEGEKVEIVKTLIAKYVELESDNEKKGKAQSTVAFYIMKSGDNVMAAAEFKKALKYTKKNPDVYAGLGLALFSASYDDGDNMAQRQEGLNYMSAYLNVAPQNHNMRRDISAVVDDLTKNQKMKPQKIK